ncbi:MAG: hypothetical protein MJZ64_01355 [Paludibacteraceae bacterium]|nr:hypothetical protein [Paludibacteraceae bacterium]
MKKIFFLMATVIMTMSVFGATALTYNGKTLEFNNDFTRTECGKAYKNVMPEVSGMACSRTTPGYLWLEGDDSFSLVATKHDGTKAMEIELTGLTGRDDWEDLATGAYNGKNYIFLGAVGDNDLAYKDNYIIYYFEEPAITSGTKKIAAKYLKLGYPDGKAHNTEAIMYDNVENILYIVDKVYNGQCSVYYIPFNLDYGTGLQKLTYVCTLGKDGEYNFQTVTAADIAPSGKYIIIKNNIKSEDCETVSKDAAYALIWERQEGESVQDAVKRQPKQIAAYELEKQGEAVAWLNDSIFYTTSDQKKDVAIYQYTRWNAKATEPGQSGEQGGETGGGDTPFVPISDDPTCDIIYDFQNNVGSQELGGTTTIGEGGKVAGSKPAKTVKFGNSFSSTSDNVTTYNYIKISPAQGGFQAGDSVVITGYIKNGSTSKHGAVAVYTSIDGQPIYTSEDFMDSEIDTESMPSAQSFVLTESTDALYLGRSGNTSTYLLEIKVYRKKDAQATALKPIDIRSVVTKFIRNGRLYLRHGLDIYTAHGQKM